jgi:hypothetical protein
MASLCEKLKYWDALLPDERQALVQQLLDRMAADYKLDKSPTLVKGAVPDIPETPEDDSLKLAAYDPDKNTMYVNHTLFMKPDSAAVFREVGHEFAHALYNDVFGASYAADPKGYRKASEEFADAYEKQFAGELGHYCKDPPPPQSPGKGTDASSFILEPQEIDYA